MKRFLVLISVVLSMLFITIGCSYDGEGKNKDSNSAGASTKVSKDRSEIKVGYSILNQNAPFYVAAAKEAESHAKKLGVKFISVDAQGDITKQINDVNDLLSQGIDVLLLDPVDPEALIPATEAAEQAGVPVVIYDSDISSKAKFTTKVLSNNYENGVQVGEWVEKQMKGKAIKAAVISGQKWSPTGLERRQGVIEGIIEAQLRNQGKSQVEIVAQGWGNWEQEKGQNAMEDIIVSKPDINLLICENDSMALGAMKAISEAGKEGEILIVAGADGQKEALELIKQGKYGATGLNDPTLIVRTALDASMDILDGKNVSPTIYTPVVGITKENVDEYYDPDSIF